ncbi:MAG: hypothetical protein AAB915_01720 [Patescibacteria group bacterium]
MILDRLEKVKAWCNANKSDLFAAALIFLVGMGGFGLGRLSVLWQDKMPLEIIEPEQGNEAAVSSASVVQSKPKPRPAPARGKFVGSRSGSAYHYPWCPGAQRIKEENKIWFATKEEAEAKGYKPAGNCPDL